MLTKSDLQAIKTLIRDEVDPLKQSVGGLETSVGGLKQSVGGLEASVSGLEKDMRIVKKDLKTVKKDVSGFVSHFDKRDLNVRKRLEVIENHLGFSQN